MTHTPVVRVFICWVSSLARENGKTACSVGVASGPHLIMLICYGDNSLLLTTGGKLFLICLQTRASGCGAANAVRRHLLYLFLIAAGILIWSLEWGKLISSVVSFLFCIPLCHKWYTRVNYIYWTFCWTVVNCISYEFNSMVVFTSASKLHMK